MARAKGTSGGRKSGAFTPSKGVFKGETFRSFRAYQNAQAQRKGFKSAATRLAAPTSKAAPSSQAKSRAIDAYRDLRNNPYKTLGEVAKENKTTPAAVRRYAGTHLVRSGRKVEAKKGSDPFDASMNVHTTEGTVKGVVHGSRARVLVARHGAAVRKLLHPGATEADFERLAKFYGRTVRLVDGRTVELVADADLLEELSNEGLIDDDGPYAKKAA